MLLRTSSLVVRHLLGRSFIGNGSKTSGDAENLSEKNLMYWELSLGLAVSCLMPILKYAFRCSAHNIADGLNFSLLHGFGLSSVWPMLLKPVVDNLLKIQVDDTGEDNCPNVELSGLLNILLFILLLYCLYTIKSHNRDHSCCFFNISTKNHRFSHKHRT